MCLVIGPPHPHLGRSAPAVLEDTYLGFRICGLPHGHGSPGARRGAGGSGLCGLRGGGRGGGGLAVKGRPRPTRPGRSVAPGPAQLPSCTHTPALATPSCTLATCRLPFVWPCPPGGRRGPIRQGPGCEMHPASAAGSAGSLASPTVAKAVSPRGRRASISHAAPRGQRQVSSAVWPGHREPPRPVGAAGCRPSSEMERGIPLPGHGLDGQVQQRGRGHGGLVTRHGCTRPPELGTMTRGPRTRPSRSAGRPGPFVSPTLARAMAAWPSHPTRRPCALP